MNSWPNFQVWGEKSLAAGEAQMKIDLDLNNTFTNSIYSAFGNSKSIFESFCHLLEKKQILNLRLEPTVAKRATLFTKTDALTYIQARNRFSQEFEGFTFLFQSAINYATLTTGWL